MTVVSNDALKREIELYREVVQKNDKRVEDFRIEVLKTLDKYLESFNKILENESEQRNVVRKINEDLSKLRESFVLVELRYNSHEADEKELKIQDFISSAKTRIKFLMTAAYIYATTLLGVLTMLVAEYWKK